MNDYWFILLVSLIGSAVSLMGGLVLLSRESTARMMAKYAVPFAVGAILAVVLFDLLPESIEHLSLTTTQWVVVISMVAVFVSERMFHRFHHHDHEHNGKKRIPVALIVAGDVLHNVLDGIAVGAAFLISLPTGIITIIAVSAHEIPREIGDFGLLLAAGYSKKKVVIINVSIALIAVVSILLTYALGASDNLPIGYLIAIASGVFVYIAVAELMPLVSTQFESATRKSANFWLLAGLILVSVAEWISSQLLN